MRRTFAANSRAMIRSLLRAFEVQPELARLAEVDVLGVHADRRGAVHQHADDPRGGAGGVSPPPGLGGPTAGRAPPSGGPPRGPAPPRASAAPAACGPRGW